MRSLARALLLASLALTGPAAAERDEDGPAPPPETGSTPALRPPVGFEAGTSAEPLPESVVLTHDVECGHEPLHGGVLVPLGAHVAHVEVTFDPSTSLFTGYILDAEALVPVRIKQPFFMIRVSTDFLDQDRMVLLVAKEDDDTGEREGDTSVFWGGNKKLIGGTVFAGMIDQIAIAGRTYREVEFTYPR